MNSIPGFDRAQRAWENMEPRYAPECVCEPRYECDTCGEDDYSETNVGDECSDVECDGAVIEVPNGTAVQGCAEHGWCTGCYDRRCEDCAD